MTAWKHLRACKHLNLVGAHNVVAEAFCKGMRLFDVDTVREVHQDELAQWQLKDAAKARRIEEQAQRAAGKRTFQAHKRRVGDNDEDDDGHRVDVLLRGSVGIDITLTAAYHSTPRAGRRVAGATANHVA